MIYQFFVILALAFLLVFNKRKRLFTEQIILFCSVFSVYVLFALWSNSYIENPFRDFFISGDQIFFYSEPFYLKNHSIKEIFKISFTDFRYSELPLIIFYYSVLMKWAQALGVTDFLLFLKVNTAFIGSLIPIFLYKIIRVFNAQGNIYRPILAFAIFSPLLYLSCQIMRDVHITLLYTIGVYLVVNDKIRFRLFYLFIIFILVYYLRVESGLFFILFIAEQQYDNFKKFDILGKVLILVGLLALFILAIIPALGVFAQTQESYSNRSLEAASVSSLGAKLLGLPFPINYLGMAAFGQMQPFPIWLPFNDNTAYAYLRILECFQSIYWLPIIVGVVIGCYRYRRHIDSKWLMFVGIAVLYIIAVSASEMNVRRQFAVYPLLFCACMYLKKFFMLNIRRLRKQSIIILIVFHLTYWVIK